MKQLLLALLALAFAHAAGAAVNLNTATKDELVALPGIGPAKAQAIVDYRNQHGPFRSVDDVRKVKGIGEKLFLQIRPELTLGGGAAPRASTGGKPEAKAEARAEPRAAPRSGSETIAREDKARK